MRGPSVFGDHDLFWVWLDADFSWPEGEAYIDVALHDDEAQSRQSIGRLSSQRPLVGTLLSSAVAQFNVDPVAFMDRGSRLAEERDGLIAQAIEAEVLEPEDHSRLMTLLTDFNSELRDVNGSRQKAPARVTLTMYLNGMLVGMVPPKPPEEEAAEGWQPLDWSSVVTDPTHECFALFPVQCVWRHLERLRLLICEVLGGLSMECALLSSMMRGVPIKILVECDLNHVGKNVAGLYLREEDQIRIDGSAFLSRPDGLRIAVLIHELLHASDNYRGKYAEADARDRACRDLAEAQDELQEINKPENQFKPNYAAWIRRRRELLAKQERAEATKKTKEISADGELIARECDALVHTLERAPAFEQAGHPLPREVLLFQMIEQQTKLFQSLAPASKVANRAAIVACLQRIKDWLDQPANEEVKQFLDTHVYPGTNRSMLEQIDHLMQTL